MQYKNLIQKIGFAPKENASGIFYKKYPGHGNYRIEVDLEKEKFDYGKSIKTGTQTSLNFSQAENWVVLECVNRLLEKGYKPSNIILEKVYPAGHGFSGRLDICVTHDDGSEYLLVECKTYGKEFDKAVTKLDKDGGQLFTYFKFSNKADVIVLYASELKGNKVIYKNEIVKIEDDYRSGDVKDFYDKWNKLTKDNGIFDSWVNPYQFVSKALTPQLLEPIKQEDSSFIFNRFLEILRHNVVSDKPNAFNKIFTLFLCKIYDEKINEGTENELGFQWLEGIDDDISFQLRLTDLYKNGMYEFLEKKVTDFSETEFENKFKNLDDSVKAALLTEFKKIRLEKNNEFAIKEVYDEKSFKENAKVVKEVVELLQGFKIRYTKKQQYLSDFFELLLTTGLKQESGQFFTPVPVAQFIIKSLPIDLIVDEKLQKGEGGNLLPFVMDYAAGSGHFLTETMHEIQRIIDKKDDKKYSPSTAKKIRNWKDDHFDWALDYVYGIEKDYRLVKVGKVGCYLHGDGLANVLHTDGLANFNHLDYKGKLKHTDKDFPQDNKQFDILVSNPPYSVSAFKNASREYYREGDFSLYDKLTDNSSEIECLFIERTKQLLKDGGVAGIILPSSILSNAGLYSKSREIILQYFEILAIAELGSNTFMATGTNTVTLFLRRRNNYESINLRIAVSTFFTNLRDVTLNGIEQPIAKYVQHVWNSISFDDYKTLLQKSPNQVTIEHEIFAEYKKKIKAKNDKEFWDILLEKEQEKLFYFLIALPQQVVVIKSGEKDDEKRFLGYEFSYRRGSEGIHSMQRGKNIEDCTSLFDPNLFNNPTKASTYIYQAFNGDFDFAIDETLTKNIMRQQLVDMLTFDRFEFEKTISLSIKKKIKIESKWEIVKISDICEVGRGRVINKREIEENFGEFPVYSSQTSNNGIFGYLNTFDFEGEYVTWTTDGIYAGSIFYRTGKFNCTNVCGTLKSTSSRIDMRYLSITLPFYTAMHVVKVANPKLMNNVMAEIRLPLPPKEIQEKVVSEMYAFQVIETRIQEKIEKLKIERHSIFEEPNGPLIRLQEITTKIGSGSTPRGGESAYIESGVTLIRSQNIYDNEFYEKGLAFIDDDQAKKLDGVTVEENDVLFNITGASVARCCIVDKSYLPARVNQHVAIIRTNTKALPKYVQQILVSSKYKAELLSLAESSSTREAITKVQLEDFKIPLPSISEQKIIAKQVEAIEREISKLEKEIAKIPQMKEQVLKKYL